MKKVIFLLLKNGVAILDNLQSQEFSSINYENNYLEGVDLAAISAKQKGINLQYKYFKYGKRPLDILTEIPKVKAWNPDFIIGPRASDKFLLLKNYFNNVALISPLATAEEVYNLPNNFYTLSSSDKAIAKAITQFLHEKFPNTKKIFIVAAIDCKSCYAVQKNLSLYYKKINQKTEIVEKQFISTDVQTVNVANMVKGYKPGDIIIIPNLSSVAAILLERIVDYIKQPGITFIGTDGWGSADVSFVGKVKLRVSQGGHDVPRDDILRRYYKGLKMFFTHYIPLADKVEVYNNSYGDARLVADNCINKSWQIYQPEVWQTIQEKKL